MTGEVTLCASCQDYRACPHEWLSDVERPDDVPDRHICDECHESLRRFAGHDEHPLTGEPAPAPSSAEAIAGFISSHGPKLL